MLDVRIRMANIMNDATYITYPFLYLFFWPKTLLIHFSPKNITDVITCNSFPPPYAHSVLKLIKQGLDKL